MYYLCNSHLVFIHKQWNHHTTITSLTILERMIVTDRSTIWYSSAHKILDEQSENGMTQYDVDKDKIIQTIQYPENMKPCRQICCDYNQKIYRKSKRISNNL